MNTAQFEAALETEGYEIARRVMPANQVLSEHAHPFDARLLVVEGEITITIDGEATRYGQGESCAVPAGRVHAETVGAAGCTMVVGRRVV